MSATKLDIPSMNTKAHDLFEIGKAFFVRNPEQKKECDKKLAEVVELLAEATSAHSSTHLSAAELKEVSRIIDKLGIVKNYLSKAVGGFNSVEENRKRADKALADKRKEKEALIAKRADERKVREDNRKKKEAEDARLKAKG